MELPSDFRPLATSQLQLETHPIGRPIAHDRVRTAFFRTIESVEPAKMHPANLRAFVINIDGFDSLISLMGHPIHLGGDLSSPVDDDDLVVFEDLFEDAEEQGICYRETICKLQTAGCRTLISFDTGDFEKISTEWVAQGKKRFGETLPVHQFDILDFDAPESVIFEQVYQIAAKSAKLGHHIAFYCGYGFGRSGVVATSIKIREIISIRIKLKEPLLEKAPHSEPILLAENKTANTTPIVAEALNFIRSCDPERGNALIPKNPRASPVGPTVEELGQVRALERLERRLVEEFNKTRV